MARSPSIQRIVAIGAFYAMYIMICWWMMCSYRLRRSIELRTLHTKYLMSYHNRREIYRKSCKEMKEVVVRFGEILGEHLNKEGFEAREIYEKVSDELKALPGIAMRKRFKAAHLIDKDMVLGRSFLGLTQEEKIDMVESYTDGSMG